MAVNRDFKELLLAFSAAEVRYLVIGAYAVMFHTEPRYTKDIDIWIDVSGDNPQRCYRALAEFGAPMHDLTVEDLASPGTIYQIGVEPNRIDILTAPAALDFDEAWERHVESTYDEAPIPMLSLEDLISNKRSVGRPQDLLDLERLEKEKDKG